MAHYKAIQGYKGATLQINNRFYNGFCGGRVDDLSFFEYLSPFCFLLTEIIVLFQFRIKYYHIMLCLIILYFD